MKDFGKKVLKWLITGVVAFIAVIIITTYFSDGRIGFNIRYAGSATTVVFTFVAVGLMAVYDLMKLVDNAGKHKGGGKAIDEAKDVKGNTVEQFYNKDFLTDAELDKDSAFNPCTFSSIRSMKKDGILVRAEEKGNSMKINFVEPIHTLVVGTTSSGKSQRYVYPSLQLMSMTAAKPSFVITDPKGELYEKCTNKFVDEGYDVKILNLRDPFASVMWNPLAYPYDLYHRSFALEDEVKVHPPGDSPRKYNLIFQRSFDFTTTTWFEFNNIAYVDKDVLESDMRVISNKLRDDAYNALNDICTSVAPIENEREPSWEQTAQKLIHGVMLAMLEDSRIPELGLTRDKYNFYNVAKICNITDSGGRDSYATLKNYLFNYRDKFSKVHDLASPALLNAESTSKNYMGFVSQKMAIFNDTAICFMTSRSEIDFVDMDEKPTAIFLIIPDESRTRYPLAVLFINQLYKRLAEKAQTIGGQLKRHVYFMLDEFGNMPAFPDFGKNMAVGRGRGIYFELVVQSYSQLYSVYGEKEGKIIKDNCPINVYIATEDMTTNKEFSELLGKKTIQTETMQRSVDHEGKESKSYSPQIQSIPIASPEELMSFRDKGKVIIKTFTPNAALKTVISPFWKSKLYNKSTIREGYVQRRMFDEQAVAYDVKKRNETMARLNQPANNDDDDDDDFDF